MRVYCGKDYEEASRIAANLIAAQVTVKPDCVLGLATGSTPIGTYKCLVEKYEKGDLGLGCGDGHCTFVLVFFCGYGKFAGGKISYGFSVPGTGIYCDSLSL